MLQKSVSAGLEAFILETEMLDALNITDVPTWVSSPAEFDQRVYADPEATWQALSILPRTALVLARLSQAAYIQFDRTLLGVTIGDFAQAQGPLFPGLYLWITAFSPVAPLPERLPPEPPMNGADPLSLENTCYYAAGMAHLCTQEGQLDRAGEYLLLARTLSRLLGMTNRTQNLVTESSRLAMLRGRPTPELLREQLLQPMPERRLGWTQRTLAESDMTVGDYQGALRSLGTPAEDCELSAALREYLHVLLDLPPLRELRPDGPPYMRFALALRRLKASEAQSPLGLIDNSPESGYAALIEAATLLCNDMTARRGFRSLISTPLTLADQRATRAVMVMQAMGDGQHLHPGVAEVSTPWREYASAAAAMTSENQFLDLIRRNYPQTYVTMALGPTGAGRPGFSLFSVPLLIGKVISYRGEEIKTPGRSGRCTVLGTLGLPHEEMTRADRKRYRELLDEHQFEGPVVDMGWVARACVRLALAARVHGQANDAAAWHTAHLNALEMMTPCVRKVTTGRAVSP